MFCYAKEKASNKTSSERQSRSLMMYFLFCLPAFQLAFFFFCEKPPNSF